MKALILFIFFLILPVSGKEYNMRFSEELSSLVYGKQSKFEIDESLNHFRPHVFIMLKEESPRNEEEFLSGVRYLFGVGNMLKASVFINQGRYDKLIRWMGMDDLTLGSPWAREEMRYKDAVLFLITKLKENEV